MYEKFIGKEVFVELSGSTWSAQGILKGDGMDFSIESDQGITKFKAKQIKSIELLK